MFTLRVCAVGELTHTQVKIGLSSTASIQENLSAWLIKCFFCHLIFLGIQIIAALTQLQGTLALLFFMC